MTQVSSNETHIPAQQNQACQDPRFSRPHGDESRTPRPQAPSRQGPRTADAVTHAASITAASINPGLTSTPSGRFGKTRRLLDARSFGRVFRNASRSRDRFFTILYTTNNQDIARLGLAISKRHSRKATDRNRIKRIIRESFRQNQALLNGLDIVVMNQPETGRASNRQLFDSLEAHWRRCSKAQGTPRES
jgi:ribonuclease P protein component